MATKKTVTKTRKKATVNFRWDNTKTSNKKRNKSVDKNLKKLSGGAILIAAMCLIIGLAIGFGGLKLVTRKDCFVLNGKDEITLRLGENYVDDGAKVISFGVDKSDKVKIETNLKLNSDGTFTALEEGTYYMVYTVDNFKYGKLYKVQKIRLISFVEPTEEGEIFDANQGGTT